MANMFMMHRCGAYVMDPYIVCLCYEHEGEYARDGMTVPLATYDSPYAMPSFVCIYVCNCVH